MWGHPGLLSGTSVNKTKDEAGLPLTAKLKERKLARVACAARDAGQKATSQCFPGDQREHYK